MEALLSDAEWSIISPLLPGAKGKTNGRPRPDDRKVLNGIFCVANGHAVARPTGTLRPYTRVCNRCNRWGKAGIWLRVFETLALWRPNRRNLGN